MHPDDFTIRAPGRVIRQPRGFWAYIPDPLPPALEWTPELVAASSAADRALGELAGLGTALPNPHLLIQPFIRHEAVLSSRIEGTRTSLDQLYAFQASRELVQLPLFDLPEDVQEVQNYVNALEYGLRRLDTLPVSLRLFRELHRLLLEGVRGEQWTPGEFRRSQNWIGPPNSTLESAVFIPPPVAEMNDALAALERFIHEDSSLPPLTRLALIHYQFEVIHPFLDGNGRVGRLLISLLLQAWGLLPQPLLYLSAYFEARRQSYYDRLLAVSQRGAWSDWLLFFLEGVRVQAGESAARVRRLQALRQEYRSAFQHARAAARLLQVIDWLFEQPLFSIPRLAAFLQVNYPTAQRYVRQLEAQGIVQEMTGQARNRFYQASRLLEAITMPLENNR
ncbi:MAG: Fic family protein [Chloroflexi bacterium]|nr:Fic family protein [Chloroflexota bacterium]